MANVEEPWYELYFSGCTMVELIRSLAQILIVDRKSKNMGYKLFGQQLLLTICDICNSYVTAVFATLSATKHINRPILDDALYTSGEIRTHFHFNEFSVLKISPWSTNASDHF